MSALRLAVMQQSAAEKDRARTGESHHSHVTSASSAKSRRKVPYSGCHSFTPHWSYGATPIKGDSESFRPYYSVQEERRFGPRAGSLGTQETPLGFYGPPTSYTTGYF